MAGRGVAPAPTALKILKGVDKNRINFQEPQPRLKRPQCPGWLSPKAKYHFKKMVPILEHMGVLTEADGDLLAAYCTAYVEMATAASSDKLEKALRQVRAFGQEFGLSPSSRSRITVTPPSDNSGSLLD